jgi:ADP-ribose pyrophosphatase YjhB (NUDIX family)
MTGSLPPQPAVGVGAVVFDPEGRVLLIRRGQPPSRGLWSLPGGRQEAGESLCECCRREILEETGIAVEPGPVVALAERRAEGFHYVIVDFLAEVRAAAPPAPASDVSDARWVALAELEGYALVQDLAEVIHRAWDCRNAGGGLAEADGAGRLFLPIVPGKAR